LSKTGIISFISIIVIACLLPLQAVAWQDGETTVVTAEGAAAVTEGNRDFARKSAIENALRNAVQRVVDVTVPADGASEQGSSIGSSILHSKSKDYIQEYRILEETADGNLCHVILSATVLSGKMKRAFEGLDHVSALVVKSDSIFLTVHGVGSCSEYAVVKNYLKNNKRRVKSIYERIFEVGVVQFELDLVGASVSFADELAAAHIGRMTFAVRDVTIEGIAIEILR